MNHIFEFSLQIYPVLICVSIGQSDDELFAALEPDIRKDPIWRMPETTKARTCFFESGNVLIRLRKPPATPEDCGALAHEIFHAAHMTLDWIGFTLGDNNTGEPAAYLIGFITKMIYQGIADHRKKPRK